MPRIRTLRVALLAIAGATWMLLDLSGLFHEKVPATASRPTADMPPVEGTEIVAVRELRRPRHETAVGSVQPVHEVAVAAARTTKVDLLRTRQAVEEARVMRASATLTAPINGVDYKAAQFRLQRNLGWPIDLSAAPNPNRT